MRLKYLDIPATSRYKRQNSKLYNFLSNNVKSFSKFCACIDWCGLPFIMFIVSEIGSSTF